MLRRVDLRAAVITEDKVKNSIHDKSLLHSTAVFSRKSGKKASYVNVGSLQAKDSWVSISVEYNRDQSGRSIFSPLSSRDCES